LFTLPAIPLSCTHTKIADALSRRPEGRLQPPPAPSYTVCTPGRPPIPDLSTVIATIMFHICSVAKPFACSDSAYRVKYRALHGCIAHQHPHLLRRNRKTYRIH
jgi:hypothetical protein